MWQNGWNAANCYFESSKDIKEIRKEPFLNVKLKKKKKDEMQMSFNLDDPLLEDIKEEILSLDKYGNPMEALMKTLK
jgi:hypothetical protein